MVLKVLFVFLDIHEMFKSSGYDGFTLELFLYSLTKEISKLSFLYLSLRSVPLVIVLCIEKSLLLLDLIKLSLLLLDLIKLSLKLLDLFKLSFIKLCDSL